MDNSLARLNLTEIFCDIDDFYQVLERVGVAAPQLPCGGEEKKYRSKLSLSEVTTIVIAFHGSGYRTFKEFYTLQVLSTWADLFTHYVHGSVRFFKGSGQSQSVIYFAQALTRLEKSLS
jgi:hypothetical protein